MKNLKCINKNVNLNDYLSLYDNVRKSMPHSEWLGRFEKEQIIEILSHGGKIWLYYDKEKPVCSTFYIPADKKALRKHNVFYEEKITGSLGPIMVHPDYVGNGYQSKMMIEIENYCKSMGKKYIFTKAHSDNHYSITNILKNGYKIVHEYENERGNMSAFIKEIK